MADLHLAFVLHFNQPINQDREVLKEISHRCYRPLFSLFNEDPAARFSVSITDSLLRLFSEEGIAFETTEKLSAARSDGKIEILHTGAYYPILPLLDPTEIKRQIEVDIEFKRREDLGVEERAGFFPPEMACDDKLIDILRAQHFKWTIIDDQLFEQHGIPVPLHEICCVNNFHVFARSSLWSNMLSNGAPRGREFLRRMEAERALQSRPTYKIIALAGEAFGSKHRLFHRVFFEELFAHLSQYPEIKLCQVSDLLAIPELTRRPVGTRGPGASFRYFPASSWATKPENAARGDAYPHWKSYGNPIHTLLWDLTDHILQHCRDIDFADPRHKRLRDLLDPAFYSLQYFSASLHYWSPNLIYKGIDLQMRALYEYCDITENRPALDTGQRIYTRLMAEILRRDQQEPKK